MKPSGTANRGTPSSREECILTKATEASTFRLVAVTTSPVKCYFNTTYTTIHQTRITQPDMELKSSQTVWSLIILVIFMLIPVLNRSSMSGPQHISGSLSRSVQVDQSKSSSPSVITSAVLKVEKGWWPISRLTSLKRLTAPNTNMLPLTPSFILLKTCFILMWYNMYIIITRQCTHKIAIFQFTPPPSNICVYIYFPPANKNNYVMNNVYDNYF